MKILKFIRFFFIVNNIFWRPISENLGSSSLELLMWQAVTRKVEVSESLENENEDVRWYFSHFLFLRESSEKYVYMYIYI